MFNLEEEIKAWKYLLDTGEIDENTYNQEIDRLKRKDERRKKHKKINISGTLKKVLIVLIFLMICVALIWFYKTRSLRKVNTPSNNVEYVKSLRNIQNPEQTEATGRTIILIDDLTIKVRYVANYKITGRVVDVQNYVGNSMEDKISSRDIGISWGFLANEENHRRINWSSAGNRTLWWQTDDAAWTNKIGGKDEIIEHCSNNHLIPSDDRNKELIENIVEGDFVRIEGYLVNVYCEYEDGSYSYWNSSTSRSDVGDGACEIIYVTNVTWLKEE